MPRELDPDRILATLVTLGQRIGERFPDSGLSQISRDLLAVANETRQRVERLSRPHWPLRAAGAAAVAGTIVLIAGGNQQNEECGASIPSRPSAMRSLRARGDQREWWA